MDFSAVLGAVSMGAADLGISGFSPTEERKEAMELSIPYRMEEDDSGQGLLVPADMVDQYQKAEDFAGKKIAVQNSSLQESLLKAQLPDAIPELVADLNTAVLMLTEGKVDAVGVAGANGKAFAKNYPQVAMSGFYYEQEDTGTSVAAAKGETELIAEINAIIEKAQEEGLFSVWYTEAVELANSLGVN